MENPDEFEQNESYSQIIEKKAETLYRTIHQKIQNLPTSSLAVKMNLLKTKTIELTPQESEQLSKFVSNETYVKQQKEDIEELSAIFKKMLNTDQEEGSNGKEETSRKNSKKASAKGGNTQGKGSRANTDNDKYISAFVSHYQPDPEFSASYAVIISDQNKTLHIEAIPENIKCFYAATDEADVILRTTTAVLDKILEGKNTFQKGFMAGAISAKGNIKILRMLDTIFTFSQG